MDQALFIMIIAMSNALLIYWGYKTLPKENWQIMAVLPQKKMVHGKWKGLNLTYYGLLSANAYAFAVIIFIILSAASGLPVSGLCLLITLLLLICMPASKIIARIVEKKSGTLTVGGAVFAGTLCAPWIVFLVNQTLGKIQGFHISATIFLAAVSVAYAYGEGLGRLACISFGCCYGKPLESCSPRVQKLFSHFHLVFSGETKKIAYASGLDNQKVIPIQVITASVYCCCGVLGTWLYLNGYFIAALLESIIVTQTWRFASEFFRADFRGDLKITPYQVMSLICVLYAAGIAWIIPVQGSTPDLFLGLSALWTPWMILFIQAVWIISFWYTARSTVTGAQISFHVEENRI